MNKNIYQPIVLMMLILGVVPVVGYLVVVSNGSGKYPSAGASLALPFCVQDLGRTSLRQRWQVLFPISNAGSRRLVLNELDLDCECVDRVRRTILIAPGETAEVNVSLDTRFIAGVVENITSFTSNDPSHPRINLTVRANVAIIEHSSTDHEDHKQVSVLIRQ